MWNCERLASRYKRALGVTSAQTGSERRQFVAAQPLDLLHVSVVTFAALHHGLTMVSRDTRDFEKTNVPILNPWKPA
jgi:hypothetical protein